MTLLYWQIGSRIRQDTLKEKRAEYGRKIVVTLSRQLTEDYGNNFNEKNLETAILREMESFILEIGIGFSFVARQKRITVDNEDYYLDLLFFHRKLKRLIAIELKLAKFKVAHKGQMELYLRWLEKYEKEPGEETPLGLILCAGKTSEQIELLQLDKSGIKVAEYMTELPKRELLEQKLHKAVELARNRLEAKPT